MLSYPQWVTDVVALRVSYRSVALWRMREAILGLELVMMPLLLDSETKSAVLSEDQGCPQAIIVPVSSCLIHTLPDMIMEVLQNPIWVGSHNTIWSK